MIGSIRTIAVAGGALGVAAIATYVGVSTTSREKSARADDGFELCLQNEIAFFDGLAAGCYTRAEIANYRDAPVIDRSADPVSVAMTHPRDSDVAPEQCATCREFSKFRQRGWYALSAREMRREAYFIRACGALELLAAAEPATVNYFNGGAPTADEMASIGAERVLRLGDDPDIEAGALAVEEAEEGDLGWRLTTAGQETLVEQIATADFDGDGIAEILVFLVAGPAGATASVAAVALLEKDGADSPLALTPQEFPEAGTGAAGAA